MTELAIIGGMRLGSLNGLQITRRIVRQTPYGEPSGPFVFGMFGGKEVVFLARHGATLTIPPHLVNYRANIWALKELGITKIISIAAVGGITPEMLSGRIVIPDQIIDYTWSRPHTFFDRNGSQVLHIDLTEPYCAKLRQALITAAATAEVKVIQRGVYGATQGPRLETAAEVRRMERDGCDILGMTGMPECALARELELSYAACAIVTNRAAGHSAEPITLEIIDTHLKIGMEGVRRLLEKIIPLA